MSLLLELPYKDFKNTSTFTLQQCEKVAELAGLDVSFQETNPGEQLLKALDRSGCSYLRFKTLLQSLHQNHHAGFQPKSKIAILIANEMYCNLAKLATPSTDCETLGNILEQLDFVVVTIKNSTSLQLRCVLKDLTELIPEDSYCFIFYAGHGCQIANIQCMLGVECPSENIDLKHCVTENYILSLIEKRQPDLVVLIMDMCRVYLDRTTNPLIYNAITSTDGYQIHKNLLIVYTTQSSQSAYEVLQIACSTSIGFDNDVTYELKTSDLNNIVPGASQYMTILSEKLASCSDINSILDKVHSELETCTKKQKPIKIQCGTEKRSLHDPVRGNIGYLKSEISGFTNQHENLSCKFKNFEE